MNGLKMIKSLVFLLTFLIFFGLVMCTKIIYDNNKEKSLNNINLMQPEGSSIKNIVEVDKDLYIMIKGGGLNDRIAVFSPQKHKVLYIINVN